MEFTARVEAITEGEEILPGIELKAEQGSGAAEELCYPVMLGMIGKTRVVHPLHRRMRLKQGRQGRSRIGTGPIETQGQRFRPRASVCAASGPRLAPKSLRPFFRSWVRACRRRRAAIRVEDVGVAIPGEQARVRYRPPRAAPWPPMYLVNAFTTRCAPAAFG